MYQRSRLGHLTFSTLSQLAMDRETRYLKYSFRQDDYYQELNQHQIYIKM